MASSQVRALNITHVHPDHSQTTIRPPPLADDDHTIVKLSFLDSFHVPTGPIQRLFFYEGPDLPTFPFLVGSLRSSLAAILPVFLPLAGKLTFRPSTGDVFVDFSAPAVSSGVKFVEAEFLGGADAMHRLASDDEHDAEAFAQLVPDLDDAGHGQLPVPVLAVQATRPADGGAVVAVGVSVHHAVADGKSLWQLMRWWSAASRGDLPLAGLVPPTFDRSVIRHQGAEELTASILRLRAPTLPTLPPSSTGAAADTARRRSRTFLLAAEQVQSLKRHISQQLSKPASAYVAVSSLAWTCIVGAKTSSKMILANDEACLLVFADCRGRPSGPWSIGEGFFGNCVNPCHARARAADLMPPRLRGRLGGDVHGIANAAAAIQEAIRQGVETRADNPFSDFGERLEIHMTLPPVRASSVVSSHRFMAYETDFGWGVPSRFELASTFGNGELVALLGARDGGMQASVSLDGACMEAFADDFIGITRGLGQPSEAT
uniref:Uncharacterized protein n=1 Tax=Avena sativa TaxID=4498 RepID=A0ACD5ZPQ4_AVESA